MEQKIQKVGPRPMTESQKRATAAFTDRIAVLFDQYGRPEDAKAARRHGRIIRGRE